MNANEYRNLTEQVQKNKEDILHHFQRDEVLADFGIKIIGQLSNTDELYALPTDNLNYGDAYAVGVQSPFNYYIWTRANNISPTDYWFDFGEISIVGPAGPAGPIGPRGFNGQSTRWYVFNDSAWNYPGGYVYGDMALLQPSGNVYAVAENNTWYYVMNIKGPQGIQGQRGEQGPQGIQGIQGPKGDTGDVGGFINIAGIVSNEYNLPDPSLIGNLTVAYLVGSTAPYDLYIQVGSNSDAAEWFDAGPLNVATMVTVGGQYQNTWDADTKLDKVTDASPGGYFRLYGTDNLGNQKMFNMSTNPISGAIPFYTGSGGNFVISTGTPLADKNCANKQYVDNKTLAVLDDIGTTYTNTSDHVYLSDSLKEHWIEVCVTLGFTDSNGNHRTAAFSPAVCRTGTQGLPAFSVLANGATDADYPNIYITLSCDDYTTADYTPLATIDYVISASGSTIYNPQVHLRVADLGPVIKV